jgi:nitrogen regulatory protein P-II 1
MMKMVVGMIQPFKLQDVTLALASVPGFPGMTVSDARGFGREHLEVSTDRLENLTDFMPCVRVEIVVEDDVLDSVVETLLTAAHTGRRGDGKVVVYTVEQVYAVQSHGSET